MRRIKTAQIPAFQITLLAWYDRARRDLPWRRTKDPYAIFVSEMMLQQTQVKTVIPYYRRWMKALPNWTALSRAPEGKVFKLWEGLGYYRRARNLSAAARQVLSDHNGRLPADEESLRALPGVGPYSAGAILSIAFGKPFPVVDGNVIRVFARLFTLRGDLKTLAGQKAIWDIARRLMPGKRCGDYNQALMELGATVCHKEQPQCDRCPLFRLCGAAKGGHQEQYPVAQKQATVRQVAVAALILNRKGRVLIRKRPEPARWLKGLWEFPSVEGKTHREALEGLRRLFPSGFSGQPVLVVSHQITHHKIECRVFRADWKPGLKTPPEAKWVGPQDWKSFALPAAHARIREYWRGRDNT